VLGTNVRGHQAANQEKRMVKLVKMRFTTTEDGSGRPHIIMEPTNGEPPFKVSLRLGADADKISALALSRLLNKSVEIVGFE
jgi:hypothetical protein